MTDLVERLRKRADIRDQISSRKSVQEGKPDRLSLLLREAADEIEKIKMDKFDYNLCSKLILKYGTDDIKDLVHHYITSHNYLMRAYEQIREKDQKIHILEAENRLLKQNPE